MWGWGRISDASPHTVFVHVMLKLVLREKGFYCKEVIVLYLYWASVWSRQSVLPVRTGVM